MSACARGNGDRLKHRETGEEKDQRNEDGFAKTDSIGEQTHGQRPDNGREFAEDSPEPEKFRRPFPGREQCHNSPAGCLARTDGQPGKIADNEESRFSPAEVGPERYCTPQKQ